MPQNIEIEITGREARLVMKYGYLFAEQAAAFEAVAGKAGYHRLVIEKFWLEMVVGDLVYSMKKTRSLSLQEELDALCGILENAMRSSYSTKLVKSCRLT